jgi:eukaryotic-like serine/threonine-protein kinase
MPPRTTLGPYALGSVLGAGGMGEVYKAIDTRLSRTVAVKLLSAAVVPTTARRQRFEREARAVSALNHPNICTLYDVGEQDGIPFLVMEFIDGESLAARLQRGPPQVKEAVRIAAEIADALDHAHRQHIVHRDLKPGNVMLSRTGAKLLDFGLARLTQPATVSVSTAPGRVDTLTEDGVILGTVQYMAPEQLEGREADARTDIFALGSLLYEMLTGRPAFAGATRASVIAAILDREPAAISTPHDAKSVTTAGHVVPPALEALVMRCLAKNPDDRWQTARDLREALRWVLEDTAPQARRMRRRPPRAASVLGSVAVVALAAAGWAAERSWFGEEKQAPAFTFSVSPPTNATFNDSGASFVVSPDGRELAFVASTPGGNTALWLRVRDSLALRPLPGTEGAAQPFWSADSGYLAFITSEGLKKIDVNTGVVQTVTPLRAGGQSGTWNRDNVILFATNRPGAAKTEPSQTIIYRVPAGGGTPVPATRLDQSRQETEHIWPQFLPDGRHFLFVARSRIPEFDGVISAGSLDSEDVQRIVAADSHGAYAPPDFLLFIRGTTLLAQRFDPATFHLTGEAVPLARPFERVSSRRGAFSVSSTGVLAYRVTAETELAWFDRSGARGATLAAAGRYRNPALSPDGSRLAVERLSEAANGLDVWIFNLARNEPARLTFDESRAPLWAPDGASIVTNTRGALVRRSAGGGPTEMLTQVGLFGNPLGWTPDGRSVVFENFHDVFTLRLGEGAAPRTVLQSPSNETQAQISPDGRWIAYVSDESGRNDVYVRRYPPGDDKWMVSNAGGLEPQWAGTNLLYLGADRTLMSVPIGTQGPSASRAPIRLFATRMSTVMNAAFTRNQYLVARDGRLLINQPPDGAPPPSLTVVVNWPALIPKGR